MAYKPKQVTLTNSSVEVVNAIRNSASQLFKHYIPKATPDADSIRRIGNIMMDNPQLQNEFLNALVNRIGKVIVVSKMYQNPLRMFKRGIMEQGETIQEVFVELARPFQYDAHVAESELYKRVIPEVRSAFHLLNYKKFYKSTVQQEDLRTAFLSWDGVTDLITKIIDSLYTGANYDEFLVMKYMLAQHILNGRLYPVTIPTVDEVNMKSIASTIKAVSNTLEFMSNKYNVAGVRTHSLKENQYILLNANFDAKMDVEVLASAFNMGKADFMGKRVLVDSFGELDIERLDIIFEDDVNYYKFTEAELQALKGVPAIILDESWFMIYDNSLNFTEEYNAQGLYWNYFYHTWKTYSVSPFANNALFVSGIPEVESVVVSPATATAVKGTTLYFSAKAISENFAPQSVIWSVTGTKSTISDSGKLSIASDETLTTLTVTATSTFDSTVKGTSVITLA